MSLEAERSCQRPNSVVFDLRQPIRECDSIVLCCDDGDTRLASISPVSAVPFITLFYDLFITPSLSLWAGAHTRTGVF